MTTRMRCSILAFAGLVASALLSGCGGSSSTTIPATATVFYAHTAVLSNFSTVLTTGYNAFGQLGNGNKDTQASLIPVVGLRRVGGVATGADHTVAFANESSVYAWGSNYLGQIGSAKDTSGVNAYSSTPVRVPLYSGAVSAIAAGGFHSLVVAGSNSTVYAWGYNAYGQLGDGTFTNRTVPVAVQVAADSSPMTRIAAIAGGGAHSLALTDTKTVYAWGDNIYGQCGVDPTGVNQTYLNRAVLVQDETGTTLQNIDHIAAGGSTSYALGQDSSGNQLLWAWGYNGGGQLGVPTSAALFSSHPRSIDISFKGANTITSIAAGVDHLLMLLSDHSVWAIGFNRFAQLGNNDKNTADSSVAVHVVGPDGITPLARVTKIMAAGNQSFALAPTQSDPTSPLVWYGWGDNGFGQLGNPISTSSIGYLLLPVIVRGF
jgi:alpha-tubulin suppressor-like RCC1 family protein